MWLFQTVQGSVRSHVHEESENEGFREEVQWKVRRKVQTGELEFQFDVYKSQRGRCLASG